MSNYGKNKLKFLLSLLLVHGLVLFLVGDPCAAEDCTSLEKKCKAMTNVPAIKWADCEGLSKAACDDKVEGWIRSWGITAIVDLASSAVKKRNAVCGLFGRTESGDVAEKTPAYDCQAYWAENMDSIPLCENSAKSMKLWGKCN